MHFDNLSSDKRAFYFAILKSVNGNICELNAMYSMVAMVIHLKPSSLHAV